MEVVNLLGNSEQKLVWQLDSCVCSWSSTCSGGLLSSWLWWLLRLILLLDTAHHGIKSLQDIVQVGWSTWLATGTWGTH